LRTKQKSKKQRDYEAEREKLLSDMSKCISSDTKERIDAAVKAVISVKEYKVTVSREGAADANNK
jgi:uncharacterized protein